MNGLPNKRYYLVIVPKKVKVNSITYTMNEDELDDAMKYIRTVGGLVGWATDGDVEVTVDYILRESLWDADADLARLGDKQYPDYAGGTWVTPELGQYLAQSYYGSIYDAVVIMPSTRMFTAPVADLTLPRWVYIPVNGVAYNDYMRNEGIRDVFVHAVGHLQEAVMSNYLKRSDFPPLHDAGKFVDPLYAKSRFPNYQANRPSRIWGWMRWYHAWMTAGLKRADGTTGYGIKEDDWRQGTGASYGDTGPSRHPSTIRIGYKGKLSPENYWTEQHDAPVAPPQEQTVPVRPPRPDTPTYTHKVTGTPLRLRSAPTLSGTIIHEMQIGTPLRILGGPWSADGHQWYKVQPEGLPSGYCVQGYSAI